MHFSEDSHTLEGNKEKHTDHGFSSNGRENKTNSMASVTSLSVSSHVPHAADSEDAGADEGRECKHERVEADSEEHASSVFYEVVQTSVSSVVATNISVFVEDNGVLRGVFTNELVDVHVGSEVTGLSTHDTTFVDHGVHVEEVDHSREDPCGSISVSHSVGYNRCDLGIIDSGRSTLVDSESNSEADGCEDDRSA